MSKLNTTKHNSFLGFVPAVIVDHLLDKLRKKEVLKLPEKHSFKSVIMFADISGFTNLSEKLSKKGSEGAELLAFTLNRYMELLVKSIGRSGGDIFKFAGDAMIVLWPPSQSNNDAELTTLCRQAIQSGLDIQAKLHDSKLVEDIKLSVKIGFGVGTVTIIYVGGQYSRAEYLPTGDPLTQAFECEHLATTGGVVIISRQMYDQVKEHFECELMKIDEAHSHPSENGPFFKVTKVRKNQNVKLKADALLIKNKIKASDIEGIRDKLTNYIPAAVLPFIHIDEEKWSAELRRLTILFVNLGIDLADAKTDEGLNRIQRVIQKVQECVYLNWGSLNKFLMDDKGSTLIVLFGLPPFAHQDDPVRGVLTAQNLVKELKKINCTCAVGITTGVVFAGVVGTAGNRREYSILGDSVNLSARLMQAACVDKDKKILIDEQTKKEAENKISFRFVYKKQVKGKTGEINFYEPIDLKDSQLNFFPYNIRTHIFTPEIGEKARDKASFEMIGKNRGEELKKVQKEIQNFIKKQEKLDKSKMFFISGPYGIGKSLFIRNIVDYITTNSEKYWKYNEKAHIIVSSLNCQTKLKMLNGWRTIFRDILTLFCARKKMKPDSLLISILEKESDLIDNIHCVEEILDLKLNTKKKLRPEITEEEEDIIINIMLKILKVFLEEPEESGEKQFRREGTLKSDKEMKVELTAPVFIVLDDMQDYDQLSWRLTKEIMENISKLMIFGSYRDKFCEIPPQIKSSKPKEDIKTQDSIKSSRNLKEDLTQEGICDEGINELEDLEQEGAFIQIDLEGLPIEDMQILIKSYFKFVNISLMSNSKKLEDISKKLEVIERQITLKKGLNSIQLKNQQEELSSEKQELLKNSQAIIDKLFKAFHKKSEGRPLEIIHFIEKLLEMSFLEIRRQENEMVIREDLEKMFEMDELLTIGVPLCMSKINVPLIDRLTCEQYLLVKAAAVIGECFDYVTLMKVNPFPDSIPRDRVRKILNELETYEYIEILDEQDHNITYRFTYSFMREAVYEKLIYNQRRQIHRFVAEAIQSISTFPQNEQNEKKECNRLIYHWCLAEHLNPFDTSQNFSNKAKRSIIVKKVSSLLSKNPSNLSVMLKEGDIFKKSEKGVTWAKRYALMNTRDFKYYYSENDYLENPEFPLGTIPLRHIFSVNQLNDSETKKEFAFYIHTSSWIKKSKDQGLREFYFAAISSDELEQWTTYIEFVRAKAIYDSFVNTFGKITFPLNMNSDKHEPSIEGGLKDNRALSRMTILSTETNIKGKKLSVFKQSATLRKGTRKTNLGLFNKGKTPADESRNIQIAALNNNHQEKLKERLLKFFSVTQVYFWSHVLQVSSRHAAGPRSFREDRMELGQPNEIITNNPHLLKVEQNLLEIESKKMGINQSLLSSEEFEQSPKGSTGFRKSGFAEQFDELSKQQMSYQDIASPLRKNDDSPLLSVQRTRTNLEMIKEEEEQTSIQNPKHIRVRGSKGRINSPLMFGDNLENGKNEAKEKEPRKKNSEVFEKNVSEKRGSSNLILEEKQSNAFSRISNQRPSNKTPIQIEDLEQRISFNYHANHIKRESNGNITEIGDNEERRNSASQSKTRYIDDHQEENSMTRGFTEHRLRVLSHEVESHIGENNRQSIINEPDIQKESRKQPSFAGQTKIQSEYPEFSSQKNSTPYKSSQEEFVLNSSPKIYGVMTNDAISRGGDRFSVQKGDLVIIVKELKVERLLQCLWNGLTGVFSESEVLLINENGRALEKEKSQDRFESLVDVPPALLEPMVDKKMVVSQHSRSLSDNTDIFSSFNHMKKSDNVQSHSDYKMNNMERKLLNSGINHQNVFSNEMNNTLSTSDVNKKLVGSEIKQKLTTSELNQKQPKVLLRKMKRELIESGLKSQTLYGENNDGDFDLYGEVHGFQSQFKTRDTNKIFEDYAGAGENKFSRLFDFEDEKESKRQGNSYDYGSQSYSKEEEDTALFFKKYQKY